MHHCGLGVVDGHVVGLCPSLEPVQGGLEGCVVRVPSVDWNANGTIVHILPMTRGVGEGVVHKHDEAQRSGLGPLGNPTG